MLDEVLQTETEDRDEDRSLPVDLTRDFIIEKCEYFASVGIWPLKSVLAPESWLSNFQQHELNHALYLLNSFMYFSDTLVDEIFAAAVRTLSRLLMTSDDSCSSLKAKWQSFIDSAIVTYTTGERPNPTDSGYQFARKARAMGIAEDRIKMPDQVCFALQNGLNAPVIIVDDFIGSGHQFFTSWDRQYGSPPRSLREMAAVTSAPFYVCPAFCTEYALGQLRSACPRLTINPGHLIAKSYSALADDSIVWPSHLRDTAVDFLRSASSRAGIPDTEGSTPEDWRGFAKLGLTIALEGSVPDATLPLFYWERNGWHPLLRRTNA